MSKIIINANREGYGTDQIRRTMTVGELIELLSDYDPDAQIFVGNDQKDYGWYTYGGIKESDVVEVDREDEEE